MPQLKKAELIRGIVYMGSPVTTSHGRPHVIMSTWMGFYFAHTPGLECVDNTTVRFDEESEAQPDLTLLKPARLGGQACVDDDDYISGGPDLVVEITASSVSRDSHMKKDLYRDFKVREYVLWRVYEGAIDWFELRGDRYELATPNAAGLIESEQFPGLVLDVPAVVRLDLLTVLARLQDGIASAAHAEFVKQLAQK